MNYKVPGLLKRVRSAVLYGGRSDESAISRRTGKAVLNALRQAGVDAVGIEADASLPRRLARMKIGFCFIALHGKYGEDGTVQGLCETLGIPYSGSGVLASALCMDKACCKMIFQSAGIATAPFQTLRLPQDDLKKFKPKISLPLVVKPADGGSAIGVSIVRRKSQLPAALREAARHSRKILVEKFIAGREVTAAVLGGRALPLIEIVPKGSFYDYKAKYVKGMSDHILPARVSRRAEARAQEAALAAYGILGCRACARVDFIVDRRDRPWILEVNTIPGMTETSLFPEAARAAGLSFPEAVLEIVRLSLAG